MADPKIDTLRHRLQFESLTLTPDGQGGFTESWTVYATRWGSFEPSGGGEFNVSQQIQVINDFKIYVRYDALINETMRIFRQGKYYQIKSVDKFDNEKGFFLEIKAKENTGT